ncbi:MAG: MFS transporter [Firmicutes bacterium]|nr:MFS transporter [Bacillota bacterium]
MKSKNILPFAVLCSVPFVMVLGNSMLIPVLPKIKSTLHLTQIQTGLIITAFSIPASLVIMFVGILSDRIGRKKVISPALIIYGMGGAGAALAGIFLEDPYPSIIVARVIQGIGAAGTAPIAIALAGDIFQSKERSKAQGLLEASNGLGKVLSPVLGAGSGLLSWWAPFALYSGIAIPAAIAVWFLIPEPKQKGTKVPIHQYFHELGGILKKKGRSLTACYIAGGVVLMILFGVLFYFSDLLESKFDVTGLPKGAIIAVPILIMSVTSFLVGIFMQTHRDRLKTATWLGLLVIAAALGVSSLIKGALWLGIAMAFVGLGSGFVLPSLDTMITSAAGGQARGMVTSIYGAVRFFGVALGPPAFGWLMDHGRFVIFIPPAVLSAAAGIFVTLALQPKLLEPPKTPQQT